MASELRVDRIIPVNGVPTGGMGGAIQTKFYQSKGDDSPNSSTSTTPIASEVTLNITPTSTSSKILLNCSYHWWFATGTTTDYFKITLFRDSTNLATQFGGGHTDWLQWMPSRNPMGTYNDFCTFQFIDTPNTTSQVTYTVYIGCHNGNTFRFNWSGQLNSLSATEFSA
jgi:hypothetical protein